MKRKTLSFLAATALVTTFAASAMAQDYVFQEEYTRTTTAPGSIESIDVTANRVGPNTPVAVKGRVMGKEGHYLIIDRRGEQIRADVFEQPDAMMMYSGGLLTKVKMGDHVTIYGTFDKVQGERALVRADAVRDRSTGRLLLTDRGDQKIADTSLPVTLRYNAL